MRLDVALAERVGSRAKAARLIEAGPVKGGGVQRPKSFDVESGMQIDIAPEPERPLAAGAPGVEFGIAYEDADLLVVDKPAGLVVHPAPGHPTGTLAQAVGGKLVHRLDRDT